MKRFTTSLPYSSRHASPAALRIRQAALAAQHKGTAVVARQHVLAVCAQIRREMREQSTVERMR